MLIALWSTPILVIVLFLIVLPFSTPQPVYPIWLSIFFFNFLIVEFLAYHRKTRKQLRAGTVSLKLTSRMELRVACTLAIATGAFTVCWFPIPIVVETN